MPDPTELASAATTGPLLGWLLRTSAEAAVIAALVLATQLTLGRWLTPAWRHRLWGLVVLRLLLPASPPSPASLWNGAAALARAAAAERGTTAGQDPASSATGGQPAAAETPGSSADTASTASPSPGTVESGLGGPTNTGHPTIRVRYGPVPGKATAGATAVPSPEAASSADAAAPGVHPAAGATAGGGNRAGAHADPSATTAAAAPWLAAVRRARAAVRNVPPSVVTALAAGWLLVTAALLARSAAAQLAFARRLRGATPVTDPAVLAELADAAGRLKLRRVPAVWETAAVCGPAAAGVWRPRVLVPPGLLAALTPAERQAVLLHELAHVRHRDVAANWLLAVLAAAHWFNPVLWLAFARLRADRELARDATVLGLTTGPGESDAGRLDPAAVVDAYARLLLKLAERVGPARLGGGTRRAAPLLPACPVTVGMVDDEAPDDGPPDDGVAPAEGGPAAVAPGSARLVGSQRSRARVADGVPRPVDGRPRPGRGRPPVGGRGRLGSPDDLSPLAPGLLGRRAGLHRRLRMITGLPATAAGRFAPAGPILFAALAVATLTGPRAAAEPGAPRPQPPARLAAEVPATRPATEPAADLAKQVEQLTAESKRLVAAGDYRAALGAIDKILMRDPTNEYARGVRPLVEDRRALREKRAAQEPATAGEERRVPHDRILEYPADWAKVAAEKPATRPVTDEDRQLHDRLDRRLPEVNFDNMGFADAIDFLRDVCQANIFVNWKALEAAGVERATPISLRLKNVKFARALQLVLDAASKPRAKLAYTVEEGVISVSTADDLAKNVVTRVYDVRDLLVEVPDFTPPADRDPTAAAATRPATRPAPRAGTRPATEPAAPADAAAAARAARAGELIKLVRETVAPDSWRDNGGSVGAVRELSGQFIVTQTPENHEVLAALLNQLRAARGIQVLVEARFLSCDDRTLADLLARLKVPASQAAASREATRATAGDGPTRPTPVEFLPVGASLTAAQADQLARAAQASPDVTIVAAPRMTLFNGQRAYVAVGTSRAYTRDYATVVAANGETRYEPVVDTVEAGLTMDVRATASADRKYATLTLQPKVSSLLGMTDVPWLGRPAGSNLTVQEPRLRTSGLNTTLSVPDGGTVLLGGMEDPGGIGMPTPATGPATGPSTRPAADTQPAAAADRPGRRLFLLVTPKLIVQVEREQEQRPFPLLRPRQ